MRTVVSIFWHDLKRLLRSPLALILLVVALVLPSAIAWYSTAVMWDPYANTAELKVAVVNEDEGVALDDITGISLPKSTDGSARLNIGEMLVQALEPDETIDWQFVDAAQGRAGLESGEYYAAFVVPDDFTKDFLSVFSGSPIDPTIGYWVNGKYNAGGLKAAESGTGVVDVVINRAFSTLVAESMTDIVKNITDSLLGATTTAKSQLQVGLDGAALNVKSVEDGLERARSSIEEWHTTVSSAKSSLDSLNEDIPDLKAALDASVELLADARTAAHTVTSEYATALAVGSTSLASALSEAASQLSKISSGIATKQEDVEKAIEKTQKALDACNELVQTLVKADPKSEELAELEEQVQKLEDTLKTLEEASARSGKATTDAAKAIDDAVTSVNNTAKSMQGRNDTFNEQILPQLDTSLDTLAGSMGTLDGALAGIGAQAVQAQNLLDQLDAVLTRMDGAFESTVQLVSEARESINAARSDLSSLSGSQTVKKLASNANVDVKNYGSFMASPVTTQMTAVYPLVSYGAGVAPFYACLALWVGCFMLIALVRIDVDAELVPEAKPWQTYLGRLMLFALLVVLQGIIVAVGDIVLGVQPAGPASFVVASMIAAFCFVSIVYALAVTFRHVGKVLAFLLLAVQIPAAMSMYPAQLMPDLFQALQSWLPFTYGMGAMRESIGGFYGGAYGQYLAWLFVCGVITSAIALVLRPAVLNLSRLFDRKLVAADLCDTEESIFIGGAVAENPAIAAMLKSDEGRAHLRERQETLDRRYGIAMQAAPIAIAVLIVVIGVMSVLLYMNEGGKLTLLMVFLGVVAVIFCACIAFEYVRDSFVAAMGDGLQMEPERAVEWQPIDPFDVENEMSDDDAYGAFGAYGEDDELDGDDEPGEFGEGDESADDYADADEHEELDGRDGLDWRYPDEDAGWLEPDEGAEDPNQGERDEKEPTEELGVGADADDECNGSQASDELEDDSAEEGGDADA